MILNNVLLQFVSDGDLHIKSEYIEFSTNLREIITIGYMIEHPQDEGDEVMRDLEHPQIAEVNKKGYTNLVCQPEHCGCDAMGDEILEGDSIIETPNGDVVLEENLEDFLIEFLGFIFKTAK